MSCSKRSTWPHQTHTLCSVSVHHSALRWHLHNESLLRLSFIKITQKHESVWASPLKPRNSIISFFSWDVPIDERLDTFQWQQQTITVWLNPSGLPLHPHRMSSVDEENKISASRRTENRGSESSHGCRNHDNFMCVRENRQLWSFWTGVYVRQLNNSDVLKAFTVERERRVKDTGADSIFKLVIL